MDNEYGVCACGHGKSDHYTDKVDGHPFCTECPHGESHHAFADDEDAAS